MKFHDTIDTASWQGQLCRADCGTAAHFAPPHLPQSSRWSGRQGLPHTVPFHSSVMLSPRNSSWGLLPLCRWGTAVEDARSWDSRDTARGTLLGGSSGGGGGGAAGSLCKW